MYAAASFDRLRSAFLSASGLDRRKGGTRALHTFRHAKQQEPTETFSERTNQGEVSSSPIGAVVTTSVGNMLSYIARAS
jgi:hypothetical protein